MIKKILLVSIIIALASCSHTVYMGNIQNIPVFKEEQELQVSTGIGTQVSISSIFVTGAYSINSYLGVIGSANYIFNGNKEYKHTNGFYGDLGIGFYKPIGNNFIFENYLGYGHGLLSNKLKDNYDYEYSKFKYHKFFNQSSISFFSEDNFFESSFSIRLSHVRYHYIDAEVFNNDTQMYDTGEFEDLLAHPNHFFVETQLTNRINFSNFKLEAYLGSTFPKEEFSNRFLNINLGLRYIYTIPLHSKKEKL